VATLTDKIKQLGGWITGGIVAGLVVVSGTIQFSGTGITLTEAQVDSLLAIPGIEILVWNGPDNLNADSGGYRKGDCVKILPIRSKADMLETINPKFKIIKVFGKTAADVKYFCEENQDGILRRKHKVNLDSASFGIMRFENIALK